MLGEQREKTHQKTSLTLKVLIQLEQVTLKMLGKQLEKALLDVLQKMLKNQCEKTPQMNLFHKKRLHQKTRRNYKTSVMMDVLNHLN